MRTPLMMTAALLILCGGTAARAQTSPADAPPDTMAPDVGAATTPGPRACTQDPSPAQAGCRPTRGGGGDLGA